MEVDVFYEIGLGEAIPNLDIYPERLRAGSKRDISSAILVTALFAADYM